MTGHTTKRRVVATAVLALAVHACGAGNPGLPSDPAEPASIVSETIGSEVSHVMNSRSILQDVGPGELASLVYGVVQTVGIDSIVIEITDAPGQANVAVGASFSVARSDWDVVSVGDTAAVVTYTSSLDLYTMALWDSATGALRLPLTAHPRTSLGHQQVFDSFNEVPTLDTCGWTPQPGLSEANDADPRSILEGYLAGTTEAFQFEAFRELHREARRQAVEIAEAAPRVEDAVASKR